MLQVPIVGQPGNKAISSSFTFQGQYLFRCRKADQLGEELQKRIDAMKEKFEMSKLSSSQWRYRNSANSGSGVYCRVVSGDRGTLQTRVQVCIVE